MMKYLYCAEYTNISRTVVTVQFLRVA